MLLVQSLSSKFLQFKQETFELMSLSKCADSAHTNLFFFKLTTLLRAPLGVCVYRGVRPPGAKIEETSGTLGVTKMRLKVI